MSMKNVVLVCLFLLVVSCHKEQSAVVPPWGAATDSTGQRFGLSDILQQGELIALTLSGPENYYEYRGRQQGTQYLLCQKFAQHLGVGLRMEVCRDTLELIDRLRQGDGDLVAVRLKSANDDLLSVADGWLVSSENSDLAERIVEWYSPDLLKQATREEQLSITAPVTRRASAPMLDKSRGLISIYDNLFRQYAAICGWDWRLIAAQCYQESGFDKNARSWAGACGLMQIMPSTADHLRLPRNQLFEPAPNVEAACRYLRELEGVFSDITNAEQRKMFVLAAYNGGAHHVRDAMALARKYGKPANQWNSVAMFVLRLRQAAFYNDPVVRYGYMRGDETVNYVAGIFSRYSTYSGAAPVSLPTASALPAPPLPSQETHADAGQPPVPKAKLGPGVPQKATKRHRFQVDE